jgi:hypothetical protein
MLRAEDSYLVRGVSAFTCLPLRLESTLNILKYDSTVSLFLY